MGTKRTTRRVRLTYPQRVIDEPIIGLMKEDFGVVPNIVRGRIGPTSAWLELKISGSAAGIRKALACLRRRGISVSSL